ncbi:MAG: carbohydrate-binding family 9-like protein [Victivallales bacterium]
MNRILPVVVLFAWAVIVQAVPPRVTAGRMPVPPTLDGRIKTDEWSKATEITSFHLFRSELAGAVSPRYPTTARIGYDRDNLYIAVRCEKGSRRNLKALEHKRDGKIYHDDSVEIFLNTMPENNNYYQFAVNSLGTCYDGFSYGSSAKLSNWSSGRWQAAAYQGDDFWTVEIKIPFCIFRFGRNPTLRFNITRNNYYPQESISWCPIKSTSDWHQPEQFGYLDGLELADFQSVTIGQFDFGSLAVGKNNLTIPVENHLDREVKLKIEISLSGLSGATGGNSITAAVPARQQKQLIIPFELKKPDNYVFNLSVRNLAAIQPFFILESPPCELKAGRLQIASTFYDTEPVTGYVHLLANPLPPDCELRISLTRNQAFYKTYGFKAVSPEILFPLGKLPPGYYETKLEAVTGKHQKLWDGEAQFWVIEHFLSSAKK